MKWIVILRMIGCNRSDMKNLGSRWTGPNIPRTAAARSLLVAAISPLPNNNNTGRRRHNVRSENNQTRRRSIIIASGEKKESEITRSYVVQQPHLSVRSYKTSLYTTTTAHSKFKKHLLVANISISRLQLHYSRHRQFYSFSPQTHSRHLRKC